MKINVKHLMEEGIINEFNLNPKEFQVSYGAVQLVELLAKQYIVSLACESFGRLDLRTEKRLTELRIRKLLDSTTLTQKIINKMHSENKVEFDSGSIIQKPILLSPSPDGIRLSYPKSQKKQTEAQNE